MKELARWAAVCACTVAFQLGVTLWFLIPYIRDHSYSIFWESGSSDFGWHPLTPYYAWPILVTYGGALVAVAIVTGAVAGRSIMHQARQAIDTREAAVGLQEEQVRIDTAKAKRTMAEAEEIRKGAREEVARCRQEAAAQIEDANARRQRSVDTNIGRQRKIQGLRERVSELEAENQELRKQVGGPEEAE